MRNEECDRNSLSLEREWEIPYFQQGCCSHTVKQEKGVDEVIVVCEIDIFYIFNLVCFIFTKSLVQ